MENRRRLMYPEGDGGGGGGGGQPAAQPGAQPAAQPGAQPGQPSAADARAFFTEFLGDPKVIEGLPDDKLVPLFSRTKEKVGEFGKQFPSEWRKLVAGDNVDHLKTLERFASPKALYDSYASLRSKMSSGELREMTPYPDKGTPEQQTQWRTLNGVPEKPEDYKPQLPQGVQLTDEDNASIQGIAKSSHESHMRPEHFNARVAWYLQSKADQAQSIYDKNMQTQEATEEALRAEWGPDYKGNIARISGFLDMAPKGVKERVLSARTAEGTALLNDADFARFLVDMSRQLNPGGVVLPGAGGNIAQSVNDEIGTIEKFMRENRAAYNKDEAKQARLRELYTARDNLSGRKAA